MAANAEPGERTPNFDVHLLGMGPEGHINSLFPDTPAVRETTRMVVAVEDSPKPPPLRITLTLPAIQRSREVWLMVSGAAKAEAAAAAIGGADPVSIPAAGAVGLQTTLWLLDKEAAGQSSRAVQLAPHNGRHGRQNRRATGRSAAASRPSPRPR